VVTAPEKDSEVISIDWQQVIGWILIGGSGIGGTIWVAVVGWKKFRSGRPSAIAERSADAPAPAGAVEWLTDVCKAMGDASAESKLAALIQGATRDQARMLRIAELEARKS
jgi:hypothetical protein